MEISDNSFVDSREQKRFGIESITLPFIGSRDKDNLCFEYLLIDISFNGVQIVIPKWVVNRELLKKDDVIAFHIPFQIDKKLFNKGKIVWARWDESLQAHVYGAQLTKQPGMLPSVFISLQSNTISIDLQSFASIEKILIKVIKDSYLLKKGVIVYLNHLVPYFLRITKYPAKDYAMLKEMVLDDVINNVTKHKCELESLYDKIENNIKFESEFHKVIDLEELRVQFESEINLDLFRQTFESEQANYYLMAIKELENKLYHNYNTVVMVYIKTM